MKFRTLWLFMLIPLMVMSQIYYWVDENGVKHYTSTPPDKGKSGDYSVSATASPEQVEAEKKALKEAIAKQEKERGRGYPHIVMYSTSESQLCQVARKFFNENRIPFTDYQVDLSEERYHEFMDLGGEGVPYILVGDKKMKGWSEETMRILLGMD